MSKLFRSKYIWFLLRIVLAGIFISASVYKIVSPAAFARQVYNFKLLPPWAINPVAIVLPWFQLLCGLGVLFNRYPRGSVLGCLLMMVGFQLGVGSGLIRGLNFECGCFQSGGSPANWWTFARDSLILLAAILVSIKIFGSNTKSENGADAAV